MRCPKPVTLLSAFTVLLFAGALSRSPDAPGRRRGARGGRGRRKPRRPRRSRQLRRSRSRQHRRRHRRHASGAGDAAARIRRLGSVRDLPHRLRHVDQRLEARPGQESAARPRPAQGCESCHGPGEAHTNDPEKVKPMQFNKIAAKAVTDTCTTCHNKRHARAVERQPARSAQCLVRQLPQHPQADVDDGAAARR